MELQDAVIDLAIIAFIFVAPMVTGHFIFSNTLSIILSIVIGLITFIAVTGAFYILFKRMDRREHVWFWRWKNDQQNNNCKKDL